METMQPERRPRRSFTKEFKRDAVSLVRSSDKTIAEVARDLDLTESALREWVRQADVDEGRRDRLTAASGELARLRKLHDLHQDRCSFSRVRASILTPRSASATGVRSIAAAMDTPTRSGTA